jgi:5-methylcytosine-specific restriction endonuclease McrA
VQSLPDRYLPSEVIQMPSRMPSYRPPRMRTQYRRDDTARPNASARGYTDKQHRKWRQAVLTRDAWACVDCGRIDQANHADHIVPVAERPDLRYELSNGACRCRACHSRKTIRERPPARGGRVAPITGG